MVITPKSAFGIYFVGAFGVAAFIGGIFGTILMIGVPLAYGVFDTSNGSLLSDPIFYVFAGFAAFFAVFAAIGGYASLLAWRSLKELRAGRSDK